MSFWKNSFLAGVLLSLASLAHAALALPNLEIVTPQGRLDLDAIEKLVEANMPARDPRVAKAIALAKHELETNQENPQLFAVASRLHLVIRTQPGALAEGHRILDRGIELFPKAARLRDVRAAYGFVEGCTECVLANIRDMQSLMPDDPLTHRAAGSYMYAQGQFADAIEPLRKATRDTTGQNLGWTWAMLAGSLVAVGEYGEGIQAYRKSNELGPNIPQTLGNLAAQLLRHEGDFEGAAKLADEALQLADYDQARETRALAEYGRWSVLYGKSANATATGERLAIAKTLMPDVLAVYHKACAFGGSDPIALALLRSKIVPVAEIDRRDDRGNTCLRNAASNRKPATLRMLVGLGADVDSTDNQGMTPLMWAAHAGDAASVAELLAVGADVNAGSPNGSALHANLMGRHPSVALLRTLLDAGADVNALDQHQRSAMFSALDSPEVMKLLLDRGANVHQVDVGGATALYGVAGVPMEDGVRRKLAEMLLARGADPAATTGKLITPIEMAREYKHEDLVRLFEEHQKRKSPGAGGV